MQNKLKKLEFTKKEIKNILNNVGVYIFYNIKEKPIYIGKSTNLKIRLSSYFIKNLGLKTSKMVAEIEHFSTIKVNSEVEALLLEAKLVRKYKPLYNSQLKDDKNPLYIRITKEKYPRVITARKIHEKEKNLAFFGPFPASGSVRSVLRMIRRIFPYSQHKIGKRACLYNQMGLCNPCPSQIESVKSRAEKNKLKQEYRKNIISIKHLLSGKMKKIRMSLVKEMQNFSKKEDFERAIILRSKIEKLDYITQSITSSSDFLKNPNLIEDLRYSELKSLANFINKFIRLNKDLRRIECFDVAHLAGNFPTASMVTFIDGKPEKTLYRHFRIRQKSGQSDTDSLKEVGQRRLKYLTDWGVPDLIIVDGGKGQVSVFKQLFSKYNIVVVGLSKKLEKLVIPVKNQKVLSYSFIERSVPKGPARNLVQRIRDEAHRFARRYHHKLLQKNLLS